MLSIYQIDKEHKQRQILISLRQQQQNNTIINILYQYYLGCSLGPTLGREEGWSVGFIEGKDVGCFVGQLLGWQVGCGEGRTLIKYKRK